MEKTTGRSFQKGILERSRENFAALGLPALRSLLPNGLERGLIAEIYGDRSSGRTSLFLHILAQATGNGECCAVIDCDDSFHPASASAAGIDLKRLVWIRCRGNAEHAMRAADFLLHAGGFGVVLLDLCDATPRVLNRIPLSYWYRFRRTVENTSTIFLIGAPAAQAKSSSLSLELRSKAFHWSGKPPFETIRGMELNATLRKSPVISPKPLAIQMVA